MYPLYPVAASTCIPSLPLPVRQAQPLRSDSISAGAVAGGLSDGTNANAVCFYPLTPNPKRKKVITRNEQL